jgi:hypothetical protein
VIPFGNGPINFSALKIVHNNTHSSVSLHFTLFLLFSSLSLFTFQSVLNLKTSNSKYNHNILVFIIEISYHIFLKWIALIIRGKVCTHLYCGLSFINWAHSMDFLYSILIITFCIIQKNRLTSIYYFDKNKTKRQILSLILLLLLLLLCDIESIEGVRIDGTSDWNVAWSSSIERRETRIRK